MDRAAQRSRPAGLTFMASRLGSPCTSVRNVRAQGIVGMAPGEGHGPDQRGATFRWGGSRLRWMLAAGLIAFILATNVRYSLWVSARDSSARTVEAIRPGLGTAPGAQAGRRRTACAGKTRVVHISMDASSCRLAQDVARWVPKLAESALVDIVSVVGCGSVMRTLGAALAAANFSVLHEDLVLSQSKLALMVVVRSGVLAKREASANGLVCVQVPGLRLCVTCDSHSGPAARARRMVGMLAQVHWAGAHDMPLMLVSKGTRPPFTTWFRGDDRTSVPLRELLLAAGLSPLEKGGGSFLQAYVGGMPEPSAGDEVLASGALLDAHLRCGEEAQRPLVAALQGRFGVWGLRNFDGSLMAVEVYTKVASEVPSEHPSREDDSAPGGAVETGPVQGAEVNSTTARRQGTRPAPPASIVSGRQSAALRGQMVNEALQSDGHPRCTAIASIPGLEDAVAMLSEERRFQECERLGGLGSVLGRGKRVDKCAVVGGSGVLAVAPFGPEIDAHDAILRVNACPVRGFERMVGSRTDVRFINAPRSRAWLNELKEGREPSPVLMSSSHNVMWLPESSLQTIRQAVLNWTASHPRVPAVRAPEFHRLTSVFRDKCAKGFFSKADRKEHQQTMRVKSLEITFGFEALLHALFGCRQVSVYGFFLDSADMKVKTNDQVKRPRYPYHYWENTTFDPSARDPYRPWTYPYHNFAIEERKLQELDRACLIRRHILAPAGQAAGPVAPGS